MAKATQMIEKIDPFTFMGLMASKGNIPGVVSKSDDKEFMLVALESGARNMVSDLTAKGDCFSLMTEFGMMKAEEPKKPFMFRIVRPTGLGGGFKGGNNFGGGAFAH